MEEQKQWAELSNEALLEEYKQSGDKELKKVLVMRYACLVKNVALKLRGVYASFAQVDDIINEGIILLMNALDKFDLSQNVKFETFICKRLRGMIIELRGSRTGSPGPCADICGRSMRPMGNYILDWAGRQQIRRWQGILVSAWSATKQSLPRLLCAMCFPWT